MSMSRNPLLTLTAGLGLSIASLASAQTAPGRAEVQPDRAAQPARAEEPVRTIAEWNLPKRTKLAIDGYDPVAYFPEGGSKPAKGNSSITTVYKGVTYRFTSEDHRDLFLEHPLRYEPAHGGWCSWAMRTGDKTEANPKSFIVKNDRLFLFYDGFFGDTRSQWLETDHETSEREADAQWKRISREEPRRVALPKPDADSAETERSGEGGGE